MATIVGDSPSSSLRISGDEPMSTRASQGVGDRGTLLVGTLAKERSVDKLHSDVLVAKPRRQRSPCMMLRKSRVSALAKELKATQVRPLASILGVPMRSSVRLPRSIYRDATAQIIPHELLNAFEQCKRSFTGVS